jgi:hypothetical protein
MLMCPRCGGTTAVLIAAVEALPGRHYACLSCAAEHLGPAFAHLRHTNETEADADESRLTHRHKPLVH